MKARPKAAISALAMSLCFASSNSCWGQAATSTGVTSSNSGQVATSTAVGVASGSGTANASMYGSLSTGGSITQNSNTKLNEAIPNVYAPALAAAGYEVCLGSMSAGASASGFGFSVGSTLEDKSCQARLNAKTLATLGYAAAAREVMCQDPNVQLAMRNAGTPCASDTVAVAARSGCHQEWTIFGGYQTVCGP